MPQFRERLLPWELDSIEPVGTAIVANSATEVVRMIATYPSSDFYRPANLWPEIEPTVSAVTGSRRLPPIDSFCWRSILAQPLENCCGWSKPSCRQSSGPAAAEYPCRMAHYWGLET